MKKEIFKELDKYSMPQTVLASNTSYLDITEMALATRKTDKIVWMHFFNPVAVTKLIEVVMGARTSNETVEMVRALALKVGKEPLVCRDSSFGFLANRVYRTMVEEAVQMVWERVASPANMDRALKLGYNFPMGLLDATDMAGGWERRVSLEEDSIRELGAEKGRVHPLARLMVRYGYIGGFGNKGIYNFYKDVLSKW